MPGKEMKCPSEICAVIGMVVCQLIDANEAINKRSVLLALYENSEQTSDKTLKEIYLKAFRDIIEGFHLVQDRIICSGA